MTLSMIKPWTDLNRATEHFVAGGGKILATGGCEEGRGGGKILARAKIHLGLKATTYDPEHDQNDQTLDSAK